MRTEQSAEKRIGRQYQIDVPGRQNNPPRRCGQNNPQKYRTIQPEEGQEARRRPESQKKARKPEEGQKARSSHEFHVNNVQRTEKSKLSDMRKTGIA
jgi:hypothetical protein